jgi:hypothetical protein
LIEARKNEVGSKYLVSTKAIIAKPCQQLLLGFPNLSSICFLLLSIQGGVIGDGFRGKTGGAQTLPRHDGRYVVCRDGREKSEVKETKMEEEKR